MRAATCLPLAFTAWWQSVQGACWRAPEGAGSNAYERPEHPVVHVSFRDAIAFTKWSGTRLPSELEWEAAARGGLEAALYPWGNEIGSGDPWPCNIWQGEFPHRISLEDGFLGTAPVRSHPANGYGLYEMCGNVWEWTAGSWSGSDHACVRRGGSYLCHDSWCNRYRVSARSRGLPTDSAGNVGFRVAK
ncbi:MAG TPA: SUMF1/EgtB/PvdO family nonheme iron enzyme [Solimonas sp.]